MRVVVDTNVFVSALVRPGGKSGQIIQRLRNGDFTLLYSDALLNEWLDVDPFENISIVAPHSFLLML